MKIVQLPSGRKGYAPDDLPPAVVEANGQTYMVGPKGELVPPVAVKPALLLQDQTAREIFAAADALACQIAVFKEWAFEQVDAYAQLLDDKYGVKAGGPKGNMTLFTFNGLLRVTVQVADRFAFGPEIQTAKKLIDECLLEWSVGSRPEVVALIQNAFRPDQEGNLNRYSILSLRKLEIADERWQRAMQAISDSERVLASARYIRVHRRRGDAQDGVWDGVSLNVATA
ncbi:MAG: DUF3164 family protein [Caulobacteraceae bacterium]